ncbi:MAG: hypothetical protein A3K19_02030 [Lentisphaerae bacterium RIFOXYB12_FULL_65_16]|nr:MAG: hypothetical protein A3K18_25250 [Lentisphaerae bacterium RIFOXYA12_64_32]OGV92578.1 MAG: hypothetical protein A3K19_02030 [Lentisphaerae bacterium RIFOXYB12_FULL_65_16]
MSLTTCPAPQAGRTVALGALLCLLSACQNTQSGASTAPVLAPDPNLPRTAVRIQETGDTLLLSGGSYAVSLSTRNGNILSITKPGETRPIWTGGEQGLWWLRFQDKTELEAADFAADSPDRICRIEPDTAAGTVRLTFTSAEADVTVLATAFDTGVEFRATVAPKKDTVLEFALPARLRFDPAGVQQFVYPVGGFRAPGIAFKAAFFQPQPDESPAGWTTQTTGPSAYVSLYGGPLNQRPDKDPPVAVRVTPDGEQWLGAALAKRFAHAKIVVNRPPATGQADLVLVDSDNGAYLSGSRLGGKGMLWRVGGSVGTDDIPHVLKLVATLADKVVSADAGKGRSKVGCIALSQGPRGGAWGSVPVSDWTDALGGCNAVRAHQAERVELNTVPDLLAALKGSDFIAILNPYGERVPVPRDSGMPAVVDAIGAYVKAGGHWFETGGYPFFIELRPQPFNTCRSHYPPAFADFLHIDTGTGSASVFGVQPRTWEPWAGAKDQQALFVPGSLSCGGDAQGGWCERPFGTYVAKGATWLTPRVRLTVGNTAPQGLVAFCETNQITRRLEDKMKPDVLDKFKNSVLVKYDGTAKEELEFMHLLPVPSQVHFSSYLKGGFDKEYPDHLPPHPSYATPEEFRRFFDRGHELGHLMVPYTNPTWWCDHPKGPTFERDGEEPLAKGLDGKPHYESYGSAKNDGWTVCHWHPKVQAANRKTVREFTDEYPVDVLFQDQCGARTWTYDTNPASPTPYAYFDGMISMVDEDSRTKPLSTEDGWAGVVNYEVQLCGLSWAVVAGDWTPDWARPLKGVYPTSNWEIFPIAQYVAHDKCAMIHHDLGQFVTHRRVLAWTLGIGYAMSYRINGTALTADRPREWLYWLDRIQKSVCARQIGQPLREFKHDWGSTPGDDDDGTIRATYGDVRIVANLGPRPLTEQGAEIAPYGFLATAPGLVATDAKRVGDLDAGTDTIDFVTQGTGGRFDVYPYAPQQTEVAVLLPEPVTGTVTVTFADQPPSDVAARDGVLRLTIPARPAEKRVEAPADLAGKAPRDWPGAKPAIGVLDVGPDIKPRGTGITPDAWAQAFETSRLATELGLTVRRITTAADLTAALHAGPTAWFAIVNPYGESLPTAGRGTWRDMLLSVKSYVENGGTWWETGAYPFYHTFSAGDAKGENLGTSGAGIIGIPVDMADVGQAPEPMRVTPTGTEWLGTELTARVQTLSSAVNRGLSRGANASEHVTLVAGECADFIGGYRLKGWGWLWRIGGFGPNPDVALPVATAAVEYLYTHPLLPVTPDRSTRFLWHATVTVK